MNEKLLKLILQYGRAKESYGYAEGINADNALRLKARCEELERQIKRLLEKEKKNA